jgi:clan AA aspartic protease
MTSMLFGRVDNGGRALVSITIFHPQTGDSLTLDAWIDSGFTGALVLRPDQIKALGLPWASTVAARLADGSQITLDTYSCAVEWFGSRTTIEVVAGSGPFALLGVDLLAQCTVVIDYPGKAVSITSGSGPSSAVGGP